MRPSSRWTRLVCCGALLVIPTVVVSCGSDTPRGTAARGDAGSGGQSSSAGGAGAESGGTAGTASGGLRGDASVAGGASSTLDASPGGNDAGRDAAGDAADSGPGVWDCSSGVGLRCSGALRLVGTAVAAGPLSDPTYETVLAREFDSVTPENATKWGELQPVRGAWSFDAADQIFAAAEANRQAVKGHTFVWHIQAPPWTAALSPSELRTALQEHITTTVARYRGRVRAWDVVNEAIDDDTLTLRAGLHATLGVAGLADAFKWVRAADPGALLFYNDYAIEGLSPKSAAVVQLLEDLVAAGAPIDGVGLQAHLSTQAFPSEESLRSNIQQFASLGLLVNVSELDVRTAEVPGTRAARLAAQRVVYQLVSGVCATEPACEGLTTWGFTDAHSWVDSTFGADDPLPFDESYLAKPAYEGLVSGLQGTLPASGTNLITNGGCARDTTGWTAFGGGALDTVAAGRSGAACRVSARTEIHHGPSQSLLGKVTSGQTVSATAWVKVSTGSAPVRLTLKKTINGTESYTSFASTTANAAEWTLLTGAATLGWGTAPTELQLYFEGPPAGVNLLVDDFRVNPLTTGP